MKDWCGRRGVHKMKQISHGLFDFYFRYSLFYIEDHCATASIQEILRGRGDQGHNVTRER